MASHSPEPRRRRLMRSDTALLLGVGFLLFASGLALVAWPEYSQRARRVAEGLARVAGIQSGLLLLGGLVFFSLGLLSRGITRLSQVARTTPPPPPLAPPPPRREDDGEVARTVGQLAGDVAQLRASFEHVAGEVQRSAEMLQRLLAAHEDLGKRIQDRPVEAGQDPKLPDSDPIFLLAASVDRVYAQLDARLMALMERVDERLASLPLAKDSHGSRSAPAEERPDRLDEVPGLVSHPGAVRRFRPRDVDVGAPEDPPPAPFGRPPIPLDESPAHGLDLSHRPGEAGDE